MPTAIAASDDRLIPRSGDEISLILGGPVYHFLRRSGAVRPPLGSLGFLFNRLIQVIL
jgi:hypothetical protein